jgi:hypothetical protein
MLTWFYFFYALFFFILKQIQTKQFAIWFIKSMSEIGSWNELENFTKQRGV